MVGTVYINGKFTRQRTTGVQRVAEQLVRALDVLPAEAGEPRWVLLHPPGGGLAGLARIEQRAVGEGEPRSLHAWEQWSLPRAARDGLLLSLAGSAPFFARRQAALIHDAAVFDHPEAYTTAFVAWYRLLFRRQAKRAERLFTVSAFSRQRLAMRLGVDPSRFEVVPNAADHLAAVPANEHVLDRHALRGRRFFLAVASANPTKNLPMLLRAFEALAAPDVLLVIVGAGNARVFAADTEGTAMAGDPPGVVRTGPLDDGPLRALYRHAVALVFPSTYEGFGLPPLEAMAEGCAVASSNAASLPEVCGEAAVFFDAASPTAIATTLARLLDDGELRARLQRAGPARAASFSWAASAALLRASLTEALAR